MSKDRYIIIFPSNAAVRNWISIVLGSYMKSRVSSYAISLDNLKENINILYFVFYGLPARTLKNIGNATKRFYNMLFRNRNNASCREVRPRKY